MANAIRIITVYGAKGGVGTSFVANNLAIGIALGTKKSVLLMDIDTLNGGSQASLLALEREINDRHLGTLSQQLSITPQTLAKFTIKHKSNVHLLAAPVPDMGGGLKTDKLAAIFLAAAQSYDNLVIDASQPTLTGLLAVCLDFSAVILNVVIPDILALQSASHFLNILEKNNYPLGKCYSVVNMANLSPDLQFEEISEYLEGILKKPSDYQLPFEPIPVIKAVNQGIPVLQKGSSETLLTAFVNLVKGMLRITPIDPSKVTISELKTPTPGMDAMGTEPEVKTTQSKALIVSPQTIMGWTPEDYRTMKQTMHVFLVKELQLNKMALDDPEKRKQVRKELRDKISEIMLREKIEIQSRKDRVMVIEEIIDEALGLGPLEGLLKDPTITEIMVNGPEQIYVERKGKLEPTRRQFLDEKQLRVIIDRIVAPLGRRIDESSPMVDARLPNRSRVNIVIPPLALNGPTITIRKFPLERYTIQNYLDMDSLSPEMAEFMQAAVEARLNILISGGTSSGKTTLLNILSSFISPGARIVTIEDAAELQLHQDHVIRLESRPANVEGKGEVPIRELVRNSLRMRPDRIIVGEVRGGEALDMLQAMNTGHEGSLTTGHANSPRDALARLETMVLMAGIDLPVRAIREQIASAIDLVIHQSRLRDGSRKVVNVIEITGMEGDVITLQEIFKYKQTGLDEMGRVSGHFEQAEIRPGVLDKMVYYGVKIPHSFSPEGFA